ncbi:PspC domain-containing protein [Demequina capsici]|uniref:PspC domain-containing protein n=1 Tax=Demequina capsici TaxID=3075620 RepID=A0AA96F4M0_9MICO|nr:PspC domain-containing protein [Demequina sp. OYTSA14]WNM23976.1 PspC domain-containing protein [Demequina sp. OYTSA14]
MTQPTNGGTTHEAAFFTTIRSWGLTRGDHGIVGGVIEGVGERIGLARVPARLLFIVIAIFTQGFAALAYAAGWALLPDRRGNIIIQNFGRGVTNVGALIGIAVLTLFGLGNFKATVPWTWDIWPSSGGWGIGRAIATIWTLAILAGAAWLVIHLVRRNRATPPDGTPSWTAPTDAATPAQPTAAAPADAAPVYAALPGEAGPGATGDSRARAAHQGTAWQTQQNGAAANAANHAAAEAQQRAWEAQAQARARAAARRANRVPGPGAAAYLTALSWLILSGVGVWIASRNDLLAVHPVVAWPVAVLIGWGVILIAVSLAGRRLGFLGVLTVLGILPVLAIGAGADQLRVAWTESRSAVISQPDGEAIAHAVESWIQANVDPEFTLGETGGNVTAEATPATGDTTVSDPGAWFTDYQSVLLRGACYEPAADTWPGADETVSLGSVTADRTIDITAETTALTIPSGTHVVLEADGNAWATVAWLDRGLACYFEDSDTTYVDLQNDPDAPTLTLVVHDDQYANTILITETPVPASSSTEVQE